jgi:hypothetical protein
MVAAAAAASLLLFSAAGCGSQHRPTPRHDPIPSGSAKRVSNNAAVVTTSDVEHRGTWRYEVRSGALRLIDGGAPPTYARLSIKLTTRNVGGRQFDTSTTIDLTGDLRAHIRRSAFLDRKCPPTASPTATWCDLAIEGLPSANQPIYAGQSMTRYYVLAASDADALLADGLRPQDVRVYARDIRIL